MWASVQVLEARLLIQLPANILGKAAEDGSTTWAPATHVGEPDEAFWLLALAWSSAGYCNRLGSEPVDVRSLTLNFKDKFLTQSQKCIHLLSPNLYQIKYLVDDFQ